MMQLTLRGGLFFCRVGTLVMNGSWWQQASQQWAMPNDSGVVQQAGHAALDRRIGVRIPAPESAAVGIEAGFVHLLACPGSQWLGGIDLASANGPIV